jgi:hypothetical protein
LDVYSILDRFPKIGNPIIPQDREKVIVMDSTPLLADAHNSSSSERFRVRCDAGDDNRFCVTTESLTVTVGQRVPREGAREIWDSVSIYVKEDQDGNLVVEVLVFDADWDEPLRIASIRSRPHDETCLTAVGCSLDHVTK